LIPKLKRLIEKKIIEKSNKRKEKYDDNKLQLQIKSVNLK